VGPNGRGKRKEKKRKEKGGGWERKTQRVALQDTSKSIERRVMRLPPVSRNVMVFSKNTPVETAL
jgi:hypothetical protein